MATQKFGPFGPFSGKLGKVIGYVDKNGRQQLRTIGEHIFENPSDQLKETWAKTSLASKFLKPVTEYISMGFAAEAKSRKMTAYNLASSFTRKAITGNYPNLWIDYSKILFSAGNMPVVQNPEVIAVEDGLMFTWDTANLEVGTRKSDLVMLMAYLPDSGKAYYLRSGAKRIQGYEHLILPFIPAGQKVETYISFNSEDHKDICNSIYTGEITFGKVPLF